MTDVLLLLVAVRVGVLITGGLLALFVFLRYLQGGSRDHLLLATGFGLIALGALVEGILFEFLGLDLGTVHTVESVFTIMGLLAVLLAIVVTRR